MYEYKQVCRHHHITRGREKEQEGLECGTQLSQVALLITFHSTAVSTILQVNSILGILCIFCTLQRTCQGDVTFVTLTVWNASYSNEHQSLSLGKQSNQIPVIFQY